MPPVGIANTPTHGGGLAMTHNGIHGRVRPARPPAPAQLAQVGKEHHASNNRPPPARGRRTRPSTPTSQQMPSAHSPVLPLASKRDSQ
eukprot:15471992-Alexandrium_andersonii.AAC.1